MALSMIRVFAALLLFTCACPNKALIANVRSTVPDHLKADKILFDLCADSSATGGARCTKEQWTNDVWSLANVYCTADKVDKKDDSSACACYKATTDREQKCDAFFTAVTQ